MTPKTDEALAEGDRVTIDYTNYRGERSFRRIIPLKIILSSNEWHPQEQWLIEAFDIEKQVWRTFAMKDIHGWSPDDAAIRSQGAQTDEALAKSFADEFEVFVTSDDEYGDQEFGQFCQKHHAEILARLRSQSAQAGEMDGLWAAIRNRDEHINALIKALKPFANITLSFDGYSFEMADIVFEGLNVATFNTSKHHELFSKAVDAARKALRSQSAQAGSKEFKRHPATHRGHAI